MIKYLITLTFSLNLAASDHNFGSSNYLSLLNLIDQQTLSTEKSNEIIETISAEQALILIEKKEAKTIDQEDLVYLDIDNTLLENSLKNLELLAVKPSYTKSFMIHNDKVCLNALNDIEKLNLGAFIPLFKEIIKITKDKAHQEGKEILHIALRVDPDCSKMKRDQQRKTTSDWHNHGQDQGDDDRYLFALTSNDKLTTMIKHNNEEIYIDKNRIFLLPGGMYHRTPDQNQGKRIQLSLSIGSLPQE